MATKLNLSNVDIENINLALLPARVSAVEITEDETIWAAAIDNLNEERAEMNDLEKKAYDGLYSLLRYAYSKEESRIVKAKEAAAASLKDAKKAALAAKKAAWNTLFMDGNVDLALAIHDAMVDFQRYPRLGSSARDEALENWLRHMGINTDNRLATLKAVTGIIEAAPSLLSKEGYKDGASFRRSLLQGFCKWASTVHKQMGQNEDKSYFIKGHKA